VLPPNGSHRARVSLGIYDLAADVTAAEQRIAALQKAPAKINLEPLLAD
jgi:hypothetical protein